MSNVRRVRPHDEMALRDIRLRALKSDPHAFGSTFQAEAGAPPVNWSRLARLSSVGSERFIALAEIDERVVGMTGGYQPDEAPDERGVWGMWVAPEARRRGIGRDLMVAVQNWSEQVGAVRMVLWVVETNEPAVTLYRSLGFSETGETQALPSDDSLVEIKLALDLRISA